MAPSIEDALVPLHVLLPTWKRKRIAENARAGRIPGAVRPGREWMMSRSAFERWTSGGTATDAPPTVEDAAADLRRRGVL